MNRALVREILNCLRVSGLPQMNLVRLQSLGRHHRGQTLAWLDQSGLALYFWMRLNELGAESALPPEARARLARNFADHRRRVADMAEEFGGLTGRLDDARVEYAVLKGFALIPEYCPDASLRTQYDYDYLLPAESLERAGQALRAAGYQRKGPKEDHPVVYFQSARPPRLPSSQEELYSPSLRRTVELHLRLWDPDEEKICLAQPEDALSRIRWRSWQGLRFPALADEDALLFQVLHAFRHILHNWCRLSVLYEIAYFLERRSSDSAFWKRFQEHIQGRPRLAECAGVVFSLATDLFGAEIPAEVRAWTTQTLPPALVLWIERYGRDSAPENFCGNKFSLFLHREFIQDPAAWREIRRRRLFPLQRPHRAAQAATSRLSARLAAGWKQWAHSFRRFRFHLGAALHYAWEIPHWERELRRKSAVRWICDGRESPPLTSVVTVRQADR